MKIVFVFLFLPLLSGAESDHQIWNNITVKTKLKRMSFGVEIENRLSESGSLRNINQIKPEIFCNLAVGKLGFIYTLESGDSFKMKTENRYSIAYDLKLYSNHVVEWSARFRQEFRNFFDQNELAYRFRLRNSLKVKKELYWKVQPSLNSEWRVYEKDSAGKTVENFSHRAILNFSKSLGCYNLNLHYTHNYQKEDGRDQNTHAFGLRLKVDL